MLGRGVVRGVVRAAAALTIVVGALSWSPVSAPASAGPARDQFDTLPVHPEWGSVTGVDGRLKRGCRVYSYSYAIDPPEGIWGLEIVVSGPSLKSLGGGAFLDGYDPTVGTGRFTMCRKTTRPGTFTIKAKLSVDDGFGNMTEGQLPPDRFRLTRTRPHHHH